MPYAFVAMFPQESLQCLHALGGQQPVPIVVIIVGVVVIVIDIAQREEHGCYHRITCL